MNRILFKKISILGIAVLATSSVIASFYSGRNEKTNVSVNGTLIGEPYTDNSHTCVAASSGTLNCHNTASAGEDETSSVGGTASTTAPAGNTTTGDNS